MFPRAFRLRRSHEILTVLRRGTRKSVGPISCYLNPSKAREVAVIVDKKVSKKATERNLVKRQVRAALREIGLPEGKLVVRVYAGALELPYARLKDNLAKCLSAVQR